MATVGKKTTDEHVTRFADMFSAMGTEPRLRIMRVLLSAHPTAWSWATSVMNSASRHPHFRTIWRNSGTKVSSSVSREGRIFGIRPTRRV